MEVLVVRRLEEERWWREKDKKQAESQITYLLFVMLYALEAPGLSGSEKYKITIVITEEGLQWIQPENNVALNITATFLPAFYL